MCLVDNHVEKNPNTYRRSGVTKSRVRFEKIKLKTDAAEVSVLIGKNSESS